MYEENEGVDYIDVCMRKTDYIDLVHKFVPVMKHYHLEEYREERRAVKFNMSLHVIFEKAADPYVVSVRRLW